MKKIITYTFLILTLFAFNYKAVSYFLNLSYSSIAYTQDYDCEEKNSGSEKSDEKDKKKDFSEYTFLNCTHSNLIINTLLFTQQSKLSFSASDYSMTVYMPPEQAVINFYGIQLS